MAQPKGLLHLLTDSRCLVVHQFAVKTVRQCHEFCQAIPNELISILVSSPYEVTAELGLDLAIDRYEPSIPDFDLVASLANSTSARARQQAKEWIDASRIVFFSNNDFAYRILTSSFEETRRIALDSVHAFSSDEESLRTLVGRIVAFLVQATVEDVEVVADLGNVLMRPTLVPAISKLGEDVICDLLASSVPEVQAIAGTIVLNHATLAAIPTQKLLSAMIGGTHPPVRSMAMKIVAELPDDVLRNNVAMLAMLTCHEQPDVRSEIRTVVKTLAEHERGFALAMAQELLKRLLTPGSPDGVPTHLSRVLREDLGQALLEVPADDVWRLLESRSGPAQEVGGHLLPTNVDPSRLKVEEIVKLTRHSVLSVRRASWAMFESSIDRIRSDLATAVRILDSPWDDSREFGFKFLRERIPEGELTPEVLISICDSTRDDVQQFGRQMIAKCFATEDGPDYLLKLSEHPASELQLFTSNLLTQYGSDDPQRLQELAPYLRSILSRVNQSRVAKDRVLQFLSVESLKNREAAEIVAGLVTRLSATCAIGDRARTIEILLELCERFPEVDVPLQAKEINPRTQEVL